MSTDEFKLVAEAALARAEKIECSIPEFVNGLGVMIAVLLDASKAALDCAKATGQWKEKPRAEDAQDDRP